MKPPFSRLHWFWFLVRGLGICLWKLRVPRVCVFWFQPFFWVISLGYYQWFTWSRFLFPWKLIFCFWSFEGPRRIPLNQGEFYGTKFFKIPIFGFKTSRYFLSKALKNNAYSEQEKSYFFQFFTFGFLKYIQKYKCICFNSEKKERCA